MTKNNKYSVVLALMLIVVCVLWYLDNGNLKDDIKALDKVVTYSEVIIQEQDEIIESANKEVLKEKKLKNNAIYRLKQFKNKRDEISDIISDYDEQQLNDYITNYKSILRN